MQTATGRLREGFFLLLYRIVGFEWDEGNARKNADKHDVSQSEAEQAFFNEPLLMVPDLRQILSEQRIHALGR